MTMMRISNVPHLRIQSALATASTARKVRFQPLRCCTPPASEEENNKPFFVFKQFEIKYKARGGEFSSYEASETRIYVPSDDVNAAGRAAIAAAVALAVGTTTPAVGTTTPAADTTTPAEGTATHGAEDLSVAVVTGVTPAAVTGTPTVTPTTVTTTPAVATSIPAKNLEKKIGSSVVDPLASDSAVKSSKASWIEVCIFLVSCPFGGFVTGLLIGCLVYGDKAQTSGNPIARV